MTDRSEQSHCDNFCRETSNWSTPEEWPLTDQSSSLIDKHSSSKRLSLPERGRGRVERALCGCGRTGNSYEFDRGIRRPTESWISLRYESLSWHRYLK